MVKFFLTCVLCLTFCSLYGVQRVVIWGHKLHTHTHSYVHYGFYKAFQAMGYETLWLDDSDDISGLDLSDSLFITEHQVDKKIPLSKDCYYVVHNSCSDKYIDIKHNKHYIDLKVYRNHYFGSDTLKQVEPYIFYDLSESVLIFPWATDLLPEEIEQNKALSPLLKSEPKGKVVYYVGTIGGGVHGNIGQLGPFMQACREAGVGFVHSNPWNHPVSMEQNVHMVRDSYLAPAICGGSQLEDGYIPCRIFKNISYGHLGLTNSKSVYDFFQGKVVYSPDTYELFFKGEQKLKERNVGELFELMDFIKEKHTYINRAQHVLSFIELLAKENSR